MTSLAHSTGRPGTNSLVCLLTLTLISCSFGARPMGWRTDGTGCYPDAQPVTEWSNQKNVLWRTRLPGWSNATPVIVGGRVLNCVEPSTLICLNATDGKILWQKENTYLDALSEGEVEAARKQLEQAKKLQSQKAGLDREIRKLQKQLQAGPSVLDDPDVAEEKRQETQEKVTELQGQSKKLAAEAAKFDTLSMPSTHGVNGYSTPTPVTDGRRVCVLFGTGVAASYDLDGNRKWIKILPKPSQGWGHSASPVLVGKRFIVNIRNEMIALDADRGEELWRTSASTGWGGIIHSRIGGVDVVITPNGDVVRCGDGKKLSQRIASLTYNVPVSKDGVVYFIDGERKAVALKFPDEAGDRALPDVLWSARITGDRYYASPLVHKGLVYAVNQKGDLSVIDAETGELVYEQHLRLGGTAYPSIVGAGDAILVSGDSGTTMVLEAGREYKVIGTNRLETFRSCPVFAGNRMYIRTGDSRNSGSLYCIGEN